MWTCRSGRLTIGLMPKLQSSCVAWALIEGVGYTVGFIIQRCAYLPSLLSYLCVWQGPEIFQVVSSS